ncbi:hypothetical protein PAAG_08077 [Paracoccidioides lutzii Pb01]|uniref:Uncharacterized protein n=1 Tax=Paracoccidioides lutzii (strain ATCC MYA-826 / Pb01) TaxID=502779 RepID=C1HBD6_PARBA|nr:hypothetical protein PAAG_08077 [Paracoccidioides lutzii Pb01]EEH37659.2 hypothetical protein PAAG_08077 [Paracoccidioides lutzii Pb01]
MTPKQPAMDPERVRSSLASEHAASHQQEGISELGASPLVSVFAQIKHSPPRHASAQVKA